VRRFQACVSRFPVDGPSYPLLRVRRPIEQHPAAGSVYAPGEPDPGQQAGVLD
jgi:hypothetical protein